MQSSETGFGERLAKTVRYAAMLGIALMVGLILVEARSGRGGGNANPFRVGPAFAATGAVTAAPGYLALVSQGGVGDKFYIIDTNRQVICVYQLKTDKIRLVSARNFSQDTEIVDSSLDVTGPDGKRIKSFEGGSGINAATAAKYRDGLNKAMEDAAKQRR